MFLSSSGQFPDVMIHRTLIK